MQNGGVGRRVKLERSGRQGEQELDAPAGDLQSKHEFTRETCNCDERFSRNR